MAAKEEALIELYRRGSLNPSQKSAVEEMARRGLISLPSDIAPADVIEQQAGDIPDMQSLAREDAYAGVAEDVGPGEAALIGMGRGFATIGRGLGLMEPEDEGERLAMEALKKKRPYLTGAGEIVGEAAPFVVPGLAAARIPMMAGRVAAGVGLGGAEGGLIAAGTDQDVVPATGIGAAIGGAAEVVFPVLGRISRGIYQRVMGSAPKGALIDAAGQPTTEFQSALDEAGINYDDLVADAQDYIAQQKPGADPAQVAKAARFQQEGVPLTRGEMMAGEGKFAQQATEQRLLESAADVQADPMRQFKLQQSEAIKTSLESVIGAERTAEETGAMMMEALTGRKKLLRTQKNELYSLAAENAKEAGGIPLFIDDISDAIPDADTLEDLKITAPAAMESLNKLLARYGISEPLAPIVTKSRASRPVDIAGTLGTRPSGYEEVVTEIPAPAMLTVDSLERFRKSLNAIERGDLTGASTVAIAPIKAALDKEADQLADRLSAQGLSSDIVEPLKLARKTVRQLKTEFSPQAITGRLIGVRRDGVTPVIEASKAYSKLAAEPVESVRRTIQSLAKAGEKGQQAIADLQTTTMLDLISAGFGTESRKINGVKVFNPIAFKNRIKSLGPDKLASIFVNNKQALNKINSIEKIAGDLIPPAGAMPKGSASVIMDLMNRLGVVAITGKLPGGQLLIEQMRRLSEGAATRAQVEKAIAASPEVKRIAYMFDEVFPGVASAFGVAGIAAQQQDQNP
jgi:hypothetical protein